MGLEILYYPRRMRTLAATLLFFSLVHASGQAPATADSLMREALTAQRSGNLRGAIENYRKALVLRPASVEARANLAAALSADGQFDEAIKENLLVLAVLPARPTSA